MMVFPSLWLWFASVSRAWSFVAVELEVLLLGPANWLTQCLSLWNSVQPPQMRAWGKSRAVASQALCAAPVGRSLRFECS